MFSNIHDLQMFGFKLNNYEYFALEVVGLGSEKQMCAFFLNLAPKGTYTNYTE